VDARVELEEFAQETGVLLLADDDEIDTVGGYVASLAGRVPQRGEVLTNDEGFDFEIAEADARKVRRVRVRPPTVNQQANKAAE
jgi:CBS domain containing-hemolysin-like protein